MNKIPSGTVTFLFTDIEGSTGLWERYPQLMQSAFARHEAILRETVAHFGGFAYKMVGDAFQVAFETASSALCAALEAQRRLHAESWGETPIRVRMALHTGVTEERGDDYVGPELNRLGRLLSAGNGGQVLLTQAVYDLTQDHLPCDLSLRDLGAHRFKDLVRPEHLYQLDAPGLPSEFPPLKTLDAFPHNLPAQLTSFIGRETEMLGIKLLLTMDKARMVTLTGSGGTGKTRLALQVAADLLEAFKDGGWLVDLAPLADPALVPQSVATAVGARQVPGKAINTVLIEYLRPRQLLLILDNCEHVVEACASLASSLLKACPDLQILATSREILGMAGEVPFRVPSMSVPDLRHELPLAQLAQSEALRLFIERAAQALPRFELTSDNAPVIARICNRLDGIPLAIELAATRVRLLSVEQIASRLDDAFRLLTGGSRTVLPRQQTLKASIDWSYNLLTQPERLLLVSLSIFAGGWTLEAAEAVCGDDGKLDVLPFLAQLVDKSLVLVAQQGRLDTRYRLLETIRQYAREKVSEIGGGERVRDRHLDYYLTLARQAAPHLRGKDQVAWLERLEMELGNLRLALEWSLYARSADGLELGTALLWFWHIRGYGIEGIDWLERLLEAYNQSQISMVEQDEMRLKRANALLALGFLVSMQRQPVKSREYLLKSLDIFRDLGTPGKQGEAYALIRLAGVAEEVNRSQAFYEMGLDLTRQLGDRFNTAEALQGLGGFLMTQGKFEEARAAVEEDLALRLELGDQDGAGTALSILGAIAQYQGDYSRAWRYFEESLACYQAVNNQGYISIVILNLSSVAWLREDYPEATKRCEQALALSRESGSRNMVANAESFMGLIAWAQGDYAQAKKKGHEALLVAKETADTPLLASSYFLLIRTALSQGDLHEAEIHVRRLVEIIRGGGFDLAGLSYLFSTLAMISRRRSQLERSVKLFSAVDHLCASVINMITPVDRRQRQEDLDALHKELSAEALAEAWNEGQALTEDQALAYAFEGYL